MPKINAFEKYSQAYDEWFINNADLYEAELEAVRQLMPTSCIESLEVGVGSGKFAAPLGIKTGVEPSEKMADKAGKQGIDVHMGVAENLPFSHSRFDCILMVTTICFVDDVLQSFKEAFRVLKPDGIIIVGFVDKKSDLGRQYQDKKENSRFYKDASFFSSQEVLAILKKAGFKTTKIRQTLISGKPVNTILDGYGKGAFVVIKAVAEKSTTHLKKR